MSQKRETRRAVGRRRAPECVFLAVDTQDNATPLLTVQAARLLRRFSMSHALALRIAELAFEAVRAER